MNKERILRLLAVLKEYTDEKHRLNVSELCVLLEKSGIAAAERKTIYNDIHTLQSLGYEIEYDNGFYLAQAPFSVSEIKILADSAASLKNMDDRFYEQLKEKLYSFISVYEVKDLRKLEYRNRHRNSRFQDFLKDCLEALRENRLLSISRKRKKSREEIFPLFLNRQNDYYYLYYHYPEKDKVYHVRLDNILSLEIKEETDQITIPYEVVYAQIQESSSSFHSSENISVLFEIAEDSEYLRERLQDDFPTIIFTRSGFSVKVSVSEPFFARIAAYGDQIKISDPQIAERYVAFLNRIITRNSPAKKSNQSMTG